MDPPLNILLDAKTERFVWVDYYTNDEPIDMSLEDSSAIESLELSNGLSGPEISALENQLPAPLPDEIKSLLASCSGFSLGSHSVSFTRYNDWSFDYLLPHVMVLTDDGTGNDWVIEIDPNSGQWQNVWFKCHDPPVLMFQCGTLAELIDGVLDVCRFEKCQTGHRSILHRDSTHLLSRKRYPAAKELRESADVTLRSFVAQLSACATVMDLRNPKIGDGFSTWSIPKDRPIKRYGRDMLFAYDRKPSFLQRLFGRNGK